MKAPYELVLVKWEDSAQPRAAWEWLDEYELEGPIICVSVGYLVAETDFAIAVAPNLGDIDLSRAQASGIMRIPRSAVRSMEKLTVVASADKAA
jgi:hypothetical protein